ncbi:MFS transporter [Yimella sp. cx-573]|nr:MFS transporter [Yimella sp. cx-573]
MSSAPATGHTDLRSFWSQLPREGKWLLSTTSIQLLGRGLTLPFTIIYLHEVKGITLDLAGTLMAWIAVIGVLVTGPGGAMIDRFGARLVSIWGSACNMAGLMMLAFVDSIPLFFVAMSLIGVAGITWPSFNSLIAAIVQGPARQTYFGISFALVNLGIGLGGIISGIYVDVDRPITFTTIYMLDALAMLIPIALLMGPLRHVRTQVERTEEVAAQGVSYLSIIRKPAMRWLLLLTFLATFIGYGQMEAGFTAFAREVGQASTRTIGWAFAVNTAVIVTAQMLVLKRISGHRRTRVLLIMAVVWALAWTLLGSAGVMPATAYATAAVMLFHAFFGFGETLMQPTIPAITNDMAPDHLRGRYNAISSGAFQAGAVAGPVAAGFLLRHEWNYQFIVILVIGCAAMAWSALALERRISPQVNGVTKDDPGVVGDGAIHSV